MIYTKIVLVTAVVLAIVVCPYRQAVGEAEAQSRCHSEPQPSKQEVIKHCCDYNGLLIQEAHAPDVTVTGDFHEFKPLENHLTDFLNSFEHPLLFRTNARYLSSISILRL